MDATADPPRGRPGPDHRRDGRVGRRGPRDRQRLPSTRFSGSGWPRPGPIDQALGDIVRPPQLVELVPVPLKRMLAEATGFP
jgi:hypothetical protein